MKKLEDFKLEDLLKHFKKLNAFDPKKYLEEKIVQINNFLKNNDLDSLVLGVSGGIDSTLVLYILNEAKKASDSPIKQILPISMPISNTTAVTDQSEAVNFAEIAVESIGMNNYVVELGDALNLIIYNSCDTDKENRIWAEGQMASVLRTPVLYYHAALLQGSNYKSLVVGTTNYSEGSYIGFFGKASDAMVDLQIISDLYKSEVYTLAEYMKIPKEIIDRVPKGDVWDNRCDEEMIGAPYWFLELYLELKHDDFIWLIESLSEDEIGKFIKYSNAIESLHKINKHKYHIIDDMLVPKTSATYLNLLDKNIYK